MTIDVGECDSPVGRLTFVVRDGKTLCALQFPESWPRLESRLGVAGRPRAADPGGVATRLRAYFAGALDALAAIPVDPAGTPFQRRVWAELRRIAPGETTSYGALARTLGMPGAARAVGAANRTNPIGIVVPCHRVVGADATLTGYAGGLDRKRWLLAHEKALLA